MNSAVDKEKLIKKELIKLKKLFVNVEDEKKKIISGLIENVAFMTISLDEIRNEINSTGYVELYQNGPQSCKKDSVVFKSYVQLIKQYNSSLKLLLDQLPAEEKAQTGDALAQFLMKK